jgi:hypothetical protein
MIIDFTNRYHTARYQRANTDWAVDRTDEPVQALVIHHTAGFYGPTLDEAATQAEETSQLDALAQDHANRFGIGPGYYYAAFPSGRLYAIGKYGTHRAHTRYKNPQTANWWNRESLAIVAFGDYQAHPVPSKLWAAIEEGIADVRSYTRDDLPIYGHREVPGNESSSQCPGDNLIALMYPKADPIEQAREHLRRALELLA